MDLNRYAFPNSRVESFMETSAPHTRLHDIEMMIVGPDRYSSATREHRYQGIEKRNRLIIVLEKLFVSFTIVFERRRDERETFTNIREPMVRDACSEAAKDQCVRFKQGRKRYQDIELILGDLREFGLCTLMVLITSIYRGKERTGIREHREPHRSAKYLSCATLISRLPLPRGAGVILGVRRAGK